MDELARRFADMADKYGQPVVEAALQAARVSGYSDLMTAVILFFTSGAVLVGSALLFRIGWRKNAEDTYHAEGAGEMVLGGCAAVVAGIVFIAALTAVLDPWVWTAINNPEVYLAKKAFKL